MTCGDDHFVELLSVQPEGGAEIDAARFLAEGRSGCAS